MFEPTKSKNRGGRDKWWGMLAVQIMRPWALNGALLSRRFDGHTEISSESGIQIGLKTTSGYEIRLREN
jgi:hypothetical protein